MNILIILNEPPYGTERSYNGLRLAKALSTEDNRVRLFLLADAVNCAKTGQKVHEGFFNIELMIKSIVRNGQVFLCGTCMDARGLGDEEIVDGAQRSNMKQLADLTTEADKVLVF